MNVKIYNRTDILNSYNAGIKTGLRLSLDTVMDIVTLKLQDKHGFTVEQLKELESEVNADFNAVCSGRVSLDEIAEAKREEIK